MLKRQRVHMPNSQHFLAILPNGLEVSVIKHSGSYGNRNGQGLWELAIFYDDDPSLSRQGGVISFPYLGFDVTGFLRFDQCKAIVSVLSKMSRKKAIRCIKQWKLKITSTDDLPKMKKRLLKKRVNEARQIARRLKPIMRAA